MDNIYQKSVNHYGKIPQLRKTQEECGELVAAIGQWLDSRINLKELATEVADVEIMCKQIRVIIGDDVVDSEKMQKILRLDNRIKIAKEGK